MLQTEDSENEVPKKIQILEKSNIQNRVESDASQDILDQSLPIIFVNDPEVVPLSPISTFTCFSPSRASTNTLDPDLSIKLYRHTNLLFLQELYKYFFENIKTINLIISHIYLNN